MSDERADPKRILALSGGGVRGIVEVAFLEAVEAEYKRRFGPQTRLCDLFHLIGGTSTGALIATALALGHPMERVADFYLTRARTFFSRRQWWRFGRAPLFDSAGLEVEIRRDIGDMTLGDPRVRTYLAIVTKRLDTGAPWIANNIPTAPYFDDPADGSFVGNRNYELAKLLRAATAAPVYFAPERIEIAHGEPAGLFVDGGLSPYNDPSLALLKLARIRRFGLGWPVGADRLFILSIGTGRFRMRLPADRLDRIGPLRLAYQSARATIIDMEEHALAMMEWMGTSDAPSFLNSELRELGDDTLYDAPLFRYLRLDLPLEDRPDLQGLDDPDAIEPLYELARQHAATLHLDQLLR